ncbi:MAG TPA: sugar phosphate isomerase/epimerase family protein [Anaerolineales bacterium]|nr:sugar phosphate isomerase/epimerase family protein [Anaerolineales bacterium]
MKRIIISDNDDFDAVFPFCLAKGLGIELQSFWDPTEPERYPARIEYQLGQLQAIDFRAFHGPFGDLNCGSYDPMIRDVSRARMLLGYQTACQLRATHIIFHHGYVPRTSPPKNWIPRFVEFWKSFLEDKPDTVQFHLENMLELSPDIMCETIDRISDPYVSACLDIGHAHCNSTTPILDWVEKLGGRIEYVHLHDNDGTSDQHLAIGGGNIPFRDVCNALNEYSPNAIWALETQTSGIRKSYDWLEENEYVPEG